MKKKTIKFVLFASCLSVFMACSKTMGDPDNNLKEVEKLIEPGNGKTLELQPTASASEYFEWSYAAVENGGPAIYQIAFDKENGDFSNPVYLTYSDNNGFSNSANISHKQLNKILGMMGVAPSETGKIKWTVFSLKGINAVKAIQDNTLTVRRLSGFEEKDIPIDVYVTGEASEGEKDLSRAHKMKAVNTGEFEVYTRLKANAPFHFTNAKSGTPNTFSISGGLIKKGGNSTVAADGVYRITLDFNTGASSTTLVLGIGFFFSPSNSLLFELPYKGNGIFKAIQKTVTFKQEGWGRDERYKFRMFVKENGGAGEMKELEWGTMNQTDSRPTPTSPESYYYLQLVPLTQWENKWKLMSDFDGIPADYTIYLQADRPYTHSVTK